MTASELLELIMSEFVGQEIWSQRSTKNPDIVYIEGWVDARSLANRIAEKVIADLANAIPATTKENK